MDTHNEMDLSREELLALVIDLRREIVTLRERIAQLEGKPSSERLKQSFSLQAEEQRREKATGRQRKQKSSRRGRKSTQEKIDNADRQECVVSEGLTIECCTLLRQRPVWRIEDGRAVLVTYDIYRGPDRKVPRIGGVLPHSEFGIEIHVSVAFLVFIVGLSIEKVCSLVKFFWNLNLSKSQADALLNQLSKHWAEEFETLCQLLSDSAVVHADETSWSINSVWAFLSEKVRVLVFGCKKDADTLETLLDKETFEGILTSDDASVYRGFSKAQKCWAHLLRKAIKLTLLQPENKTYCRFLDQMLGIYRTACGHAKDQRLSAAGRQHKVDLLTDQMCDLCGDRFSDESVPQTEVEKDYFNLVHELVRLLGEQELFTFVLHPQATGTNNEAERSLRQAALDRKTNRTSKTPRGARRRTILVSVFESLRLHVPDFTLSAILNETATWLHTGQSLFAQLPKSSGLSPPQQPLLQQLIPT